MLISKPKPGFVTIPTPSPPSISISFTFSVSDSSTIISAPWVTSGSSPPSLITEHFALFDSNSQECIGISIKLPLGNLIDTFSVFCWLIIDNNADLDAAVAELPVV